MNYTSSNISWSIWSQKAFLNMPFKVIAKLLKLCARKLYNALYIRNECPLTNNRLFV